MFVAIVICCIEAFFHIHPVFRYEEFARLKAEQGVDSPHAARKALLYYTNTARLINVRRGIYAVVPPDVSPDRVSNGKKPLTPQSLVGHEREGGMAGSKFVLINAINSFLLACNDTFFWGCETNLVFDIEVNKQEKIANEIN